MGWQLLSQTDDEKQCCTVAQHYSSVGKILVISVWSWQNCLNTLALVSLNLKCGW